MSILPTPFLRVVALLLVPCLIANPAGASGSTPPQTAFSAVQEPLFTTQALVASSWLGRPIRWIQQASVYVRQLQRPASRPGWGILTGGVRRAEGLDVEALLKADSPLRRVEALRQLRDHVLATHQISADEVHVLLMFELDFSTLVQQEIARTLGDIAPYLHPKVRKELLYSVYEFRRAGEGQRSLLMPALEDMERKLIAAASPDEAAPAGVGTISGSLTPDEERTERKRIAQNSVRTQKRNPQEVGLIEQRAKRLLLRQFELQTLLRAQGLSDFEIQKVIDSLTHPLDSFKWFHAQRTAHPGKYYLGNESALAVNVIEYLHDIEVHAGYYDLIDEYLLHEAIERSTLQGRGKDKHHAIIDLTRAFFQRDEDENPLGDALRDFIDLDWQNYPERTKPRIAAHWPHPTRGSTESMTHKALDYLKRLFIALSTQRKTLSRKFGDLLLQDAFLDRLRVFGLEAVEPDQEDGLGYKKSGSEAVRWVSLALIEQDRGYAEVIFNKMLVHPDEDIRRAGARLLEEVLQGEPTDPLTHARYLVARQDWKKLQAYAPDHPRETQASLNVLFTGKASELKQIAVRLLDDLGPAAEEALVVKLQRPNTKMDTRVAILIALRHLPNPTLRTIDVVKNVAKNAFEKRSFPVPLKHHDQSLKVGPPDLIAIEAEKTLRELVPRSSGEQKFDARGYVVMGLVAVSATLMGLLWRGTGDGHAVVVQQSGFGLISWLVLRWSRSPTQKPDAIFRAA